MWLCTPSGFTVFVYSPGTWDQWERYLWPSCSTQLHWCRCICQLENNNNNKKINSKYSKIYMINIQKSTNRPVRQNIPAACGWKPARAHCVRSAVSTWTAGNFNHCSDSNSLLRAFSKLLLLGCIFVGADLICLPKDRDRWIYITTELCMGHANHYPRPTWQDPVAW